MLLFLGLTGFLAWYLLSKDKGEREPASILWAALGFGALGLIPAGFLETALLPNNLIEAHTLSVGAILLSALAVGIIEEVVKFVPLALFIYRKRYFNEHTDGILYFALAGVGFGLPENILYSVSYGSGVGVARAIITPFFHAAMTAYVGFYLVRAKLSGKKPSMVWLPLLTMIGIHGIYDFGLFQGSPLLVLLSLLIAAALTATLFVLGAVAKRKDQEIGLSVVGNNAFCRSCGFPNSKKLLYCQHCGQRA